MKLRHLSEILGMALLLILPFVFPLLTPHSTVLLHNRLAFRPLFLGLLIDAGVLFVVGSLLFALVPRLSPLARTLVTGLLCGLICWWLAICAAFVVSQLPLDSLFPSLGGWSTRVYYRLSQLGYTFVSFAAALAVLRPAAAHTLARALRLGLAAFSTCALWIVPQLVYIASLHPGAAFDRSSTLPDSGPHRRIVWILMDELSHDLVFDHPLPGASYSDLRRLQSTSVVFDRIEALDSQTENVVPSLLQGHPFDAVKAGWNGNLVVHDRQQPEWASFTPENSLFGLARDRGWNPGVAGWYNPYCRIFQSVLTACSWRPGLWGQLPLQSLSTSRESVLQNALTIPRLLLSSFWNVEPPRDIRRQQNLEDFTSVLSRARHLLQNDKIHLVFLHLPVPHPPGLYNRQTRQLCACGNYIDNLSLANDTLAVLLQDIDRSPSAVQTTVILSSDHSWRADMWKTKDDWTPEEDRIAQRFSDTRPVFLVHFPGQQRQVDIAAPTPQLAEHDLIAAMLQGSIASPDDLLRALPASARPAASAPARR